MPHSSNTDTTRLLARYSVSTETTPNGDLMVVLESPDKQVYKRVVPKDLKDVVSFVNRFKLDMLIAQGQLPRKDILQAVRKETLPTYLPGTLETTRYARLWHDRKIGSET